MYMEMDADSKISSPKYLSPDQASLFSMDESSLEAQFLEQSLPVKKKAIKKQESSLVANKQTKC